MNLTELSFATALCSNRKALAGRLSVNGRRSSIFGILILALICLGDVTDVHAQERITEAAEASTDWVLTETIPAAEAVQAAAAEGPYVYAISSRQIAKYERSTGRKVAISSGDAHHLNSGFFWQGKLYCAHSNYPMVPERSEIKVLDPESMQLSNFRDFGNFGGSLTWAVHHRDNWWCNFALYGADNAKTFLVQFDSEWRELRRWSYPAALISQLGDYSLSGGIWRNDQLLVTGHDDPILFRLRMPTDGNQLEYVDSQTVPFTGQGFAVDPQTGGLIGISRAQKQVRISEEQQGALQLRVLTYNIHHAEGTDGKLDLERIATVIRSVKPDIVALQEVDCRVNRTGGVDQPAELSRLTEMTVVFGANIDLQGGHYGNALLSRFPIIASQNSKLPLFDDGEQRGVLEVELELPSPYGTLRVLTTHFDHRQDDRERVASARWIHDAIMAKSEELSLLAGDLNDLPASPTLTELGKLWSNSTPVAHPTIPAAIPTRQIDYILFRPAASWKIIETTVLDEPIASDHRPLLAVFELSASSSEND